MRSQAQYLWRLRAERRAPAPLASARGSASPPRPAQLATGQDGGLTWVLALVALLTIAKLVVAAYAPISFDEALYWRYSRHLAAGYIDHPFVNPLGIRIGTSLLGSTPLGVRLISVLSNLVASWAIWRASLDLFADKGLAARALLFANLTAVFSVGAIAATSDEMVVAATCVFLACLARKEVSGDRRWWLLAGVACGAGLCAKYTMGFVALGAALWLVSSPGGRRELRGPTPWAAGAIAFAVFSPVLAWNAQHHWASFIYQSGRLTIFRPGWAYIADYLGSLALLSTPPIFLLGLIGAWRFVRGEAGSGGRLIIALALPLGVYLLWHATHQRVQGNWSEPIVPLVAVAAAYAARPPPRANAPSPFLRVLTALVAPVALAMAAVTCVGATTPLLSMGRHDLRARALGVGWPALDAQIVATAQRTHARLVLTTDYTVASWGAFYGAPGVRFDQVDERVRWSNEPPPDAVALRGPALYVCKEPCHKVGKISARFRSLTLDHIADRQADGRSVDRYRIYLARDPTGPVLDPTFEAPLADHADDPGAAR